MMIPTHCAPPPAPCTVNDAPHAFCEQLLGSPTPTIETPGVSEDQVLAWATAILEKRFYRSNYLTSPDQSRAYLRMLFAGETREKFGMVAVDSQNGVLGFAMLFQGTVNAASVYPREVVKAALDFNAASVIIMHNHPSGCAEPSRADINITQQIVAALKTVDIPVLDHLILAGLETVSFAERGLLP